MQWTKDDRAPAVTHPLRLHAMSARRALAFSFLDRYSGLVLSVGSSMVIARLLTPAEIGVFSVTMVLLTILTALRDMGAGQYLVQEPVLDDAKIRAAWTVSLGTGCVAALLVAALAVPVSHFYDEPRMVNIMLIIGLNFAINPFGSLTYAWLIREMRFEALASMRFLSALAGTVTSVGFAWTGHGPISLAYGSLMTTLVNALVASFHRPTGFPLIPTRRNLRAVLSKGSKFSGSGLIAVLGGAAPELILAKIQSLAATAMYSRANGVCTMFQKLVLDATQVVAVSLFAKEHREGGNLQASFIRSSAYVTALGWSFFAGLALLSHPAINLLYGNQWGEAVAPTRLIAAAYLVGLPAAMCSTVLQSLGQAGRILRVTFVVLAVQVTAMTIGAFADGLRGIALAMIASSAFSLQMWLRETHKLVCFPWPAFRSVLARSAWVALFTQVGPLVSIAVFGWAPQAFGLSLVTATLLGCACFLLGLHLTSHPLKGEVSRLMKRS